MTNNEQDKCVQQTKMRLQWFIEYDEYAIFDFVKFHKMWFIDDSHRAGLL